jgi:hypothetical protein
MLAARRSRALLASLDVTCFTSCLLALLVQKTARLLVAAAEIASLAGYIYVYTYNICMYVCIIYMFDCI